MVRKVHRDAAKVGDAVVAQHFGKQRWLAVRGEPRQFAFVAIDLPPQGLGETPIGKTEAAGTIVFPQPTVVAVKVGEFAVLH